MVHSSSRVLSLGSLSLFLLLGAGAPGCTGCGQKDSCSGDSDCGDGESCQGGECQPSTTSSSSGGTTSSSGRTPCDSDAECRADETCNQRAHVCLSRHECDTAQDCQSGQECRDFNGDTFRECGFPGCNADAECVTELGTCGAGLRPKCVNRACACASPCGGDCGTTRVCCGITGTLCGSQAACCADDPGPCANQTPCQPGFTRDVATGTWSVDACDYTGVRCHCAELPPLPLGDIGNPSAIAMDNSGKLYALAYNKTYGDVMLGTATGGGALQWRFLDGVPAGGAVTGGPSGPRGGVSEPGPDVGRYLDLAVSPSGVVHAVYQDASAGTLLYARVMGDSTTRFVLDAQAETGVYPSVALDGATGAPRVAYLTRRDDSGARPMGRLRMAAAHDATPTSAQDFVFHTLAETDLTTVACQGGCPTGTQCAAAVAPALPTCLPEAQCNCDVGQFCSTSGCVDQEAGSATRDVPQGPGMWPALTIRPDGKPVLAAYDSFATTLVVYTTSPGAPVDAAEATFEHQVLDGQTGDAGLWPAIECEAGGTVHVAYIHGDSHALLHVALGANLSVMTRETVDDAARINNQATDLHRLAEPALSVANNGTLTVVYQDGTTGELLMASGTGAPFARQTLAGGGAGTNYDGVYGFSNDIVGRSSGSPIISTVRRVPDATPPVTEMKLFNWAP